MLSAFNLLMMLYDKQIVYAINNILRSYIIRECVYSERKIINTDNRRRKGGIDVTGHSKSARRFWNRSLGRQDTDIFEKDKVVEYHPTTSKNIVLSIPPSTGYDLDITHSTNIHHFSTKPLFTNCNKTSNIYYRYL